MSQSSCHYHPVSVQKSSIFLDLVQREIGSWILITNIMEISDMDQLSTNFIKQSN